MILPCPLCQARFAIPEEKIKDPGTKIRCPKCHFTFTMKTNDDSDGVGVSTDTDPNISRDLAQRVMAEAEEHKRLESENRLEDKEDEDQNLGASSELELEEVDKVVIGLSPEELANLNHDEIVDADDLAQVAEQSGETIAKKKISAKAEAEAAGQWPSIIVDEEIETAQIADDGLQQTPSAEESRDLSSHRFKTVKIQAVAIQEQEPAPDRTDASESEAAVQVADTVVDASAGYGVAGLSPSAVAETYVIPGRQDIKPGFTDDFDDDLDESLKPRKSFAWLWVFSAVLIGGGLIAGALWIKSKREAEAADMKQKAREKMETVKEADPRWDDLQIGIPSKRVIKRHEGGRLLVVDTSVKNDSRVYRYGNVTLDASLFSSADKAIDSGWTRCGVTIGDEDIVKAVRYGGRAGFYSLLEKRALVHEKQRQELGDGEMLQCRLVFFTLPKDESTDNLRYKIEVDRNRTRITAAR